MATATAKKKVTEEEVDLLLETAHSIETLSKDKALAMATHLVEERGFGDFRLGGLLTVINQNGWWEPYESYKAYLGAHGIQYRKACYLSDIYTKLVEAQIPWSAVKDVGWTKLKEMVRIPLTPDNVEEWAEKAQSMTVVQLLDAIKKAKGLSSITGTESSTSLSTMTFKVHEDQKDTIRQALDKIREEMPTEHDAVALEALAIAYMGGEVEIKTVATDPVSVPEVVSLAALLKKEGYEAVLSAWEEAFPELDLTLSMT
jgi:hypothetical protein